MTLAMPLVLLLGIVVFLLVRSGELSTWHVVLVALFGFCLDRTHLADPIAHLVTYLIHRH